MAGLIIAPRARIFHGHEWVYATEIKKSFGDPQPGDVVTLKDFRDRPLGSAIYNPLSQIIARRFSRRRQDLDADFFMRRIRQAIDYRQRLGIDATLCRLVWSESDGIPGLIVDRYGAHLSVQTLTLAMDQRKDMIVSLLQELFGAKAIVERNDVPSREHEGLPLKKGWLVGTGDSKRVVTLGRGRFEVDLLAGQKTGEYLEQDAKQMAVGALTNGRKVLDCFSYHGGFAIQAALNGAASVHAVDISEDAVAIGRRNAELNGLAQVTWKAANVFDDLNARVKAGEAFDVVVLDPPSFTKSRARLEEALRGYKEINLRAFKLLPPGGLLATFGCSHHVDVETFRAVVLDAAFDAHKILRLRGVFGQPADHPVIPAIPETEYLKGFLFEVV